MKIENKRELFDAAVVGSEGIENTHDLMVKLLSMNTTSRNVFVRR